jgi:catechol 2,3-dioxygenase-like lactoylglutathione lyase family enzyme
MLGERSFPIAKGAPSMNEASRPGAVYAIDHYAIPTNDLLGWMGFMERVLGGDWYYTHGLTTSESIRGGRPRTFYWVGMHEIGGFLQRRALPPAMPLGSLPRFGFWIRPEELDHHRRRLDDLGVEVSDPVRTSQEGEEGTALYFRDPDGNQYELWAPRALPPSAMDGGNKVGLGRISHAVLGSQDLERTAAFYSDICGVEPIRNDDVEHDTLAIRLVGGGRLVFKQVEGVSPRAGGTDIWNGQHLALTIRDDEWEFVHDRMWEALPETVLTSYEDFAGKGTPSGEGPRTQRHGKVLRGEHAERMARGTYFYDWDQNSYHFTRGHFEPGDPYRYTVQSINAD